MKLAKQLNYEKYIHAGLELSRDIEACGLDGSMSKLDASDKDHPANSALTIHKAAKAAGFQYAGSKNNGATLTHTYHHKDGILSPHHETVARQGVPGTSPYGY